MSLRFPKTFSIVLKSRKKQDRTQRVWSTPRRTHSRGFRRRLLPPPLVPLWLSVSRVLLEGTPVLVKSVAQATAVNRFTVVGASFRFEDRRYPVTPTGYPLL